MVHIQRKMIIHAPFADVVPSAINSHPEQWPVWYVGLSAPTMVRGEGEVGTVSEHSFMLMGQHFPIEHRVVESTNDGTTAHWKAEFTGEISGRHSWTYHQVDGVTEVEVEHEMAVPARLTETFGPAFAEHVIDGMLGLSLESLKALSEAPVGAA
jgi:hypothetical protein